MAIETTHVTWWIHDALRPRSLLRHVGTNFKKTFSHSPYRSHRSFKNTSEFNDLKTYRWAKFLSWKYYRVPLKEKNVLTVHLKFLIAKSSSSLNVAEQIIPFTFSIIFYQTTSLCPLLQVLPQVRLHWGKAMKLRLEVTFPSKCFRSLIACLVAADEEILKRFHVLKANVSLDIWI